MTSLIFFVPILVLYYPTRLFSYHNYSLMGWFCFSKRDKASVVSFNLILSFILNWLRMFRTLRVLHVFYHFFCQFFLMFIGYEYFWCVVCFSQGMYISLGSNKIFNIYFCFSLNIRVIITFIM